MATAHLIHGYLGAGKTTFAKRLERELPGVRFSHDEWMARLFGEDSPAELFQVRRERVWDLMATQWTRCLELGLDVVLDLGFWARAERDAVRAQVTALGAGYRLYALACPEDQAWARIETRNRDLAGSLLITRNTFEALKSRFESLSDDETCVRVDVFAGGPSAG
jgi:predicted kinase